MDETEFPAEDAAGAGLPAKEASADFIAQGQIFLGNLWQRFQAADELDKAAYIFTLLGGLAVVYALLTWPARRARKKREAREREELLTRTKAAEAQVAQMAEDAEARHRDASAEREEASTERSVMKAMIEQLVAAQTAGATEAGHAPDAEAVETLRQSATAIAAGGEARETALKRFADGDETGGLDDLFALAREASDAEFWAEIGDLAFMNHTQKALAAYEQAVGLDASNAHVWNQIGGLNLRLGNLAEAETAFSHVLETAGDDKQQEAAALGNLGLIARTRGDLDEAEDYLKRSLAISQAEGFKELSASQLGNLGVIAQTRGELDKAEDYHQRSLAIETELGRKEGQAINLGNLGIIAETRGDMREACRLWGEALALYEEIGMPQMVETVSGWMKDAGCGEG